MKRARYEDLSDDGISCGENPDCNEVYTTSATHEECTILLEEVLEEWLLLRISRKLDIPVLDSLDLRTKESV